MRSKSCFVALFSLFVLLSLSAQEPAGPRTVVVLLDLSLSCANAGLFPYYREDLNKVLKGVGFGDTIVVANVTGDSSAELELPVNETLPAFEATTDNPLVLRGMQERAQAAMGEQIKHIEQHVDALLQTKQRIETTDLFGGMELAARIFRNYPNPKRILIVMSDMQQDAEGFDFARLTLSDKAITALLKRLGTEGRLPDLRGTKVLVTCARPPHGDLSRYRAIRSFWTAYFRACKGVLDPAAYGAALIRFVD